LTNLPANLFAKMILASKCEGCPAIYTMHLRYPRFIHAEAKTHRVLSLDSLVYDHWIDDPYDIMGDRDLSRNARSSRAVPVKRMIEEVRTNPAMPWRWTANQPGMQGVEGHNALIDMGTGTGWHETKFTRESAWQSAALHAADIAEAFMDAGYHKQVCNRLLEPFMWIDTLVTATEWDNFFELRDHPDAEPHIRDLAILMRKAIQGAKIRKLKPGEWHMPYVTDAERAGLCQEHCLDLSAVRNARISYAPFDGQDDFKKEMERVGKLKGEPLHASPFEHVAMADPYNGWPQWHRNFTGYAQYRGFIEDQMQ
jgi:hypothetical protein